MAPLFFAIALLAQAQVPVEIPFRSVAFGSNGKIKEGGAIVIRDAAALDAYRTQMGTTDVRKPTIDWSKDQIVAVHAAGTGYGGTSLQVNKVRRKADGAIEVEAYLDRGSCPAVPTTGFPMALRKEGIYALVAVSKSTGAVTLKIVEPPRDRPERIGKTSPR